MIAAVMSRQQAAGLLGIAHDLVKVDHFIEVARSANPGVDRLPVALVRRPGMIVIGAGKRCDGAANHPDPMGVGAHGDLLIVGEDASYQRTVFRGRDLAFAGEVAEVVDSLEQDQPANPRLGEHVAIHAGQRIPQEESPLRPVPR